MRFVDLVVVFERGGGFYWVERVEDFVTTQCRSAPRRRRAVSCRSICGLTSVASRGSSPLFFFPFSYERRLRAGPLFQPPFS